MAFQGHAVNGNVRHRICHAANMGAGRTVEHIETDQLLWPILKTPDANPVDPDGMGPSLGDRTHRQSQIRGCREAQTRETLEYVKDGR